MIFPKQKDTEINSPNIPSTTFDYRMKTRMRTTRQRRGSQFACLSLSIMVVGLKVKTLRRFFFVICVGKSDDFYTKFQKKNSNFLNICIEKTLLRSYKSNIVLGESPPFTLRKV